jgi:broad specificity phosphatase PhoE
MIYLVRHGETQFNIEGRLQGGIDLPLVASGARQASEVGNRLASLVDPSWAIWSSPLKRAHQSAEIIAERLGRDADSIIIEDRLREVGLGDWEGLTYAQVEDRWPKLAPFNSLRRAWHLGCPNGESPDLAFGRLGVWLKEAGSTNLIVVCHGIVGSLLRGIYAKLSMDEMLSLPTAHTKIFQLDQGEIKEI